MHRLAMQGNLVDAGSDMMKLDLDSELLQLVCPKPRCLDATSPEFLNPIRCKHSHSNDESSSEVLGVISTCKISDEGSRQLTRTGCSLSCYCGSPPSRSDKPVVHDVQLVHQTGLQSPLPLSKLWSRMDSFSS